MSGNTAEWAAVLVAMFAAIFAWRAFSATRRLERPYVFFNDHVATRHRHDESVIVSIDGITFRNDGRTSAYVRYLTVGYAIAKAPPIPETLELERYPETVSIRHGKPWPEGYYMPLDIGKREFDANRPYDRDGEKLFVVGRLIYTDALDNAYYAIFTRVYVNGSFAFDPDGLPDMEGRDYNDSRALGCLELDYFASRSVKRKSTTTRLAGGAN